MEFGARRRRAVMAMRVAGLRSLVVTHGPDVRWLTGFTGSSGAVALVAGERGAGRAVLFTDGRYTAQARAEVGSVPVRIVKGAPGARAAAWLAGSLGEAPGAVGFDAVTTSVAQLDGMRAALPEGWTKRARAALLKETAGMIAGLREVKDADEQEAMRRASALGCALFEHVLGHLRPDVTEAEVAAQLEFAARTAGADGMSFETIVAGGKRSSMPHARATGARLPKRGFVTLDFGVLLGGYCSDMTRTVHIGTATRRERDVYDSVLNAEAAGIAVARAGTACQSVDKAARDVLKQAGWAKWFSHSTGHGVGLEIHEGPRLAAKIEQPLQAGMVVTVEPGVYLPDEFGVRIEDAVLVTADGCEVLTAAADKALLEL